MATVTGGFFVKKNAFSEPTIGGLTTVYTCPSDVLFSVFLLIRSQSAVANAIMNVAGQTVANNFGVFDNRIHFRTSKDSNQPINVQDNASLSGEELKASRPYIVFPGETVTIQKATGSSLFLYTSFEYRSFFGN